MARVRGRDAGKPAVLLACHYDSVAAGPGAADDGAGVATTLEVARALTSGPPPAMREGTLTVADTHSASSSPSKTATDVETCTN